MKNLTAYTTLIESLAHNFNWDPDLLESQVMEESSGDPKAIRYEDGYYRDYIKGNAVAKGYKYGRFAAISVGLLQILFETALELGFTGVIYELCDPATGLYWGLTYLTSLRTAYGTADGAETRIAIGAYNGGPRLLHHPVDQWPPGPKKYVQDVYTRAGKIYTNA